MSEINSNLDKASEGLYVKVEIYLKIFMFYIISTFTLNMSAGTD